MRTDKKKKKKHNNTIINFVHMTYVMGSSEATVNNSDCVRNRPKCNTLFTEICNILQLVDNHSMWII